MDIHKHFPNHLIVAVVGEFNAGKSSLINQILGADILPTDIFQTTATINLISFDGELCVTAHHREAGRAPSRVSDLSKFNAENGSFENIEFISVTHPMVPHDILLIDTPGFNDPDARRDRMFLEILPICDAILFVVNADQPMKASEIPFLKSTYTKLLLSRTYLILNHADELKEPAKVAEQKRYVSTVLHSLFGDSSDISNRVFAICSKKEATHASSPPMKELLESEFVRVVAALHNLSRTKAAIFAERRVITRLLDNMNELSGIEAALSVSSQSKGDQATVVAELIAMIQRQLAHLTSTHDKVMKYREDVSLLISRERENLLKSIRGRLKNRNTLSSPQLADQEVKSILNGAFETTIAEFSALSSHYISQGIGTMDEIRSNLEKANIEYTRLDDIARIREDQFMDQSNAGIKGQVCGYVAAAILSSFMGPPGAYIGVLAGNLIPLVQSTKRKSEVSATLDDAVNQIAMEVDGIFGKFSRKISEKEETIILRAQAELAKCVRKKQWDLVLFHDASEFANGNMIDLPHLEKRRIALSKTIATDLDLLKKARP